MTLTLDGDKLVHNVEPAEGTEGKPFVVVHEIVGNEMVAVSTK